MSLASCCLNSDEMVKSLKLLLFWLSCCQKMLSGVDRFMFLGSFDNIEHGMQDIQNRIKNYELISTQNFVWSFFHLENCWYHTISFITQQPHACLCLDPERWQGPTKARKNDILSSYWSLHHSKLILDYRNCVDIINTLKGASEHHLFWWVLSFVLNMRSYKVQTKLEKFISWYLIGIILHCKHCVGIARPFFNIYNALGSS